MMRATVSILPLRLRNAQFATAEKTLLNALTFEIPADRTTIILGPNGAGKSLTLRLCHGILMPTAGHVDWALPGGVREGRRRHAMLFQKPVMLRRSARGNITHALAAAGISRGKRRSDADAVLERFGLAEVGRRPARLLSGGQQQQLALARAVALRPELLFLDEPSSNLDPGATRQFEDLLGRLRAEGMTLVMSTHDLGQARRLADRVLFLHRGRIVEQGPAEAFFNSPQTPEARAFLSGDLLW